MRTITAPELAAWRADPQRPAPLVLDVREPWETELVKLPDSLLVPMRQIPGALDRIDRDRPVVCLCHHGARSLQVAQFLEHHGFADVINLHGGIDAWARQVDRSLATY
ncbi:MAG: rhodanese-like domain-containing protein [Lautropia sp.]